jgi:hypothetical protein
MFPSFGLNVPYINFHSSLQGSQITRFQSYSKGSYTTRNIRYHPKLQIPHQTPHFHPHSTQPTQISFEPLITKRAYRFLAYVLSNEPYSEL